MSAWIAIDGGQSEVRVRHSDAAETLRGPGYVHGPHAVTRIVAAIAEAAADAPVPASATVGLGHTGYPADPAGQAELGAALADLFGATGVRGAPDWVTAHLGALGGKPGIVLAVGTGAVCLGAADTGPSVAVGGWGPVFGDPGSAFWIGRSGIEAALRHSDGRTRSPELHDATARMFGADLHVAVAELYAAPDLVDRVAQFAPAVVHAAQNGSAVAHDIVARAVDAYVEMVRTAAERLPFSGEVAVSYTGGVLGQATHVLDLLEAELARHVRGARLTAPLGDGLTGAEVLATAGAHPFDDLVTLTPGRVS